MRINSFYQHDKTQYKQNFCAILQLNGAYKDLPQRVITDIEYMSKHIGNDNDVIYLDIGKKSSKIIEQGKVGCKHLVTNFYRDNYIFAFINGELMYEKFLTNANGGHKKDMWDLNHKIYGYLKSFKKKFKP